MLAKVHNKLAFPIVIADKIISAHGTEEIDLPQGFKVDTKRISVSYITNDMVEKKVEPTEIVETKVEKPKVESKPKPKKKTKKRNTK